MAGINVEGLPAKGPEDAKVVLVEFADYQCPHCKHAGDALKPIAEQFKDDLRIVYADFPINRSGVSRKVAEGAACAFQQDKFWEYNALAFDSQRDLKADSAKKLAEELKLDMEAFDKCLASDYPAQQVARGEEEGKRLGVDATPSLFLNGRRLHLNDLAAELPKEIEQILAGDAGQEQAQDTAAQ
ncbi:MAG: thioredoxin domain-containing protein [Thiolinea sp.]